MPDDLKPAAQATYRPARVEDWPAVAPIVAQTWDGEDYITEALWREWATRPQGALIVAEAGGRLAGFARIAYHGPAEWWLEGLRVAPEMQGRGLARGLTQALFDWFEQHGDGMVRLSTYSENEPSQHLARAFGMRHIGSYASMAAPARPGDYRSFRLLRPRHLDLAYRFLRRSPVYRANHFVEVEWKLYNLTRDRLAEYLADDAVEVLGWRQADALRGLALLFKDEGEYAVRYDEDALRVGALYAGDDTTLHAMLRALRGLAAYRGAGSVTWKMPAGVGLERVVEEAGFEPEWEDGAALWLFERPLKP